MNRLKMLFWVIWTLGGLVSQSAGATSFASRPFPDTVQDTPVIVRGKTGTGYSDWGKSVDATKRIYTYYELQVEDVIKGSVQGPTIVIRELGGEKDGIGMEIAGSAHFEKGEEVVVLLGDRNAEGSFDIQGLMTGKFNIKRDESGNEVLQGALGDDHELGPAEKGSQGDTGNGKKWTIEALKHVVAEQARAPKVQSSPQNSKEIQTASSPRAQSSPAAPQLQSSEVGASESLPAQPESPSNGHDWRLWAAAVLLAGGLGIWAVMRKRS